MDNQPKFCPNCGAAIEPNARFCVVCGKSLAVAEEAPAVEEAVAEAPVAETPVEEAPVAEQAPTQAEPAPSAPVYNYYQSAPQKPAVSKKNSIISMIFGLVALESAAMSFMPIYAFIFLPIALVFAILGLKKSNNYVEEAGASNAFSKVGKIVSIISIPLSVFFGIIGLVLTIAFFSEM